MRYIRLDDNVVELLNSIRSVVYSLENETISRDEIYFIEDKLISIEDELKKCFEILEEKNNGTI